MDQREPAVVRRLFAEVLGTGFLVFIAAGVEIEAALSPGRIDVAAKAFAPALVVGAMIYATGDVSGAHFNPAVTLAFALRRVFDWREVPAYWAAQLTGAIAAAALLRALFGTVGHVGRNELHTTIGRGLALESLLTWFLITVILNTATRHRIVGAEAAIAVAFTIAACGLFAEPLTGASMNPARSLGTAIVSGRVPDQWIYVVGPAIGAALAIATTEILHPRRSLDEVEAASGERGGSPEH